MADVTSRVETVSNAGVTVATLGDNFLKHTINQADVGRELIVKFAKTAMTNADVTAYRNAITLAGGVAGALPARQARSMSGGFHCNTLDLKRKGGLESYFG